MLYRVVLLVLHFLILLPNSIKCLRCCNIVIIILIGTEQCTERFMELPLVTYRAQRIGMNLPEKYVGDNRLRVLTE